jgi:hypothetical protein
MMFSVQAKAVGPHRQGSVVGLRQTMNRLAAIVIPPAMGAIADHWGAGQSFVISRHRFDCTVRPGYLDHPARGPDRNKSGGADLK